MSRKILSAGIILIAALVLLGLALSGRKPEYRTFADYPGFEEYYKDRCQPGGDADPFLSGHDRELLERYRPRFVIPPGGRMPMDFYRDYLPATVLRFYEDDSVAFEKVTLQILNKYRHDQRYYLDFMKEQSRPGGAPSVYGRVHRGPVSFPCGGSEECIRELTFLKYNLNFSISGLPATLPAGHELLLRLAGLDPENWHELDNFVAVHVVLNEDEKPIAALLAQHNHHRTYMLGKDMPLPEDGRLVFDVALRSNEIYPASESAASVEHRVVRWSLHMDYLISGEDPPLFHGVDVTRGLMAGGEEVGYGLEFLSPCDPFYTATIMLGEPRPLFGRYIGRDGPPGADYYAVPELLPLGNLLKLSYLHEGNREDVEVLSEAIDREKGEIDYRRIMAHGGSKFYRDLTRMEER